MIAISLSPNTEQDDVLLALRVLFQPWRWIRGEEISRIESWFESYLRGSEAVCFNSGRSALYAILKVLGIGKGDEVLIQAFTCLAVPNSILWVGAKPVYVDIEKESYNLNCKDLEKKITEKSKAVVVQNTFGIPAKIEKVKKIAQKHGLLLIEDCAHSLGGQYENGQKMGTVGEAAFFSFGRDKVISSVFGGMVIINPKSEVRNPKQIPNPKSQIQNIKKYQGELKFPSRWWVLQQLLHPLLFSIILPVYNFFELGKIFLLLFQKLRLLSVPVLEKEKRGEQPEIFPQKFPNALGILALNQLKKVEKFNKKRRKFAEIYQKYLSNSNYFSQAVYLRYPLLVTNPDEIYERAKKKGILLGRWYSNLVDPKGVDLERVGYKKGSCPVAEEVAKKILNLPTYPRMTEKDVSEVVKILDDRLKNPPV